VTFPEPPQKGQPVRAELIKQIIDCLRMFRPVAGANIRTQVTPGGTIINGTPGGARSVYEIAPFTVRHHADQWEIYLPDGCCNYGGTCAPINAAASSSEDDDHENDDPAWRILTLDESAGTTGEDADGNTYREWNVEIHVKPSAKMWNVDDLNKPARRLVWACAVDRLKPSASVTDAERYANTPGDFWSCVVARVRATTVESDGESDTARKVTQLREIPVDVADYGETLSGFGLVWYFSIDDGALKVEKVYCLRQVAAAAGIAITGDTMTDVTGASSVYALINTADMSDGEGLIQVLKDPQGTTSTPYDVWLPLYQLTLNTVTADNRAQSLANIQLFHA